jgi:hypothetical protein
MAKRTDPGSRKIYPLPGIKKDEPLNLKKKRIDDKLKIEDNIASDEFDLPVKMEVKTAESIESEMSITLPINLIRPMGSRMFCKEITATEKRTKGGIILATKFEQTRGEDVVKRDYKRYFVIDVANDLTRTFKPLDPTEPERKPRRGDEVFIFVPEEAKRYSPVEVIDWNNGGMRYIVFEEMEIAGIGLINLISEEDKKE